jgi:HTH-type transcriptional repressor of NAD biosynthesis genes
VGGVSGGRLGVTVGKFNPPHLGHRHLLATAAARCDSLHVLVGTRPGQTLDPGDRAAWLVDALPDHLRDRVVVHLTPEDIPEHHEPWAARALQLLPRRPDVAFTSEAYGGPWAGAMGCAHESVDPARTAIPISGTAMRADLRSHFDRLVPAARAALCRRVVLVGAESTGKSTLAQALAATLRTTWAPEHGRTYWEGRQHLRDQTWATAEFRHIAHAQQALADALARSTSAGVLLCDTDALTTAVWHRRYTGADDPGLEALARRSAPDTYLVCAPDFDWVQDGTRESRAQRQAMHDETLRRVETACRHDGVPWHLLTGPPDRRLADALAVVDDLTRFPPLT